MVPWENQTIRFDGKHWIGKKRPNEKLQADYVNVAKQARKALGRHGIVAIPNARPDEYRFEEVVEKEGHLGNLYSIEEGKVVYDKAFEVYFMKAQEVKTQIEGVPIVLLAYNLPFGINLNDKDGNQTLEEAAKYNCILGINLPSCIDEIKGVLDCLPWLSPHKERHEHKDGDVPLCKLNPRKLYGCIDFVVGYSGGLYLKGTNKEAIKFYRKEIQKFEFDDRDYKEKHKIGIIAVSGGHRTPNGKLEEFLNGGQTIGSSYTEIPEPNPNNFMNDLRQSLRNSTEANVHCEPIIIEAIKSQLSIKVGDRIRKLVF